jgi:hypothetical protein
MTSPKKPVTNFKESFKRSVKLYNGKLRSGKSCYHEKHFRNCIRQVIHWLDLRAQADKQQERFTWVSPKWLLLNCRDVEEQPFERTMIWASVRKLESLHIIQRAKRVRDGYEQTGWIVASHADITIATQQECIICDAKTEAYWKLATQHLTQQDAAATQHPTQHSTQRPDKKYSTLDSTSDSTSKSPQDDGAAADNTNDSGTLHREIHKELHDPSPLSPLSTGTTLTTVLKDGQEKTESFQAGTWTVEQSIGQTANLEDMLAFISDNTINNTNPLMNYEHIAELKSAIQSVLARESKTVVTDRLVLRKLMEHINSALRAEDIQPPRFWLPVMLTLKKGGPIQMQPSKYRCQVCNGPTNGESICDACSMAA